MKIQGLNGALSADLQLRRQKMQAILAQEGLDAALITGNVNLTYATGRLLDGYYYLPVAGEAVLFFRQGMETRGEDVVYVNRPEMIPQMLGDLGRPLPQRLALEGELPFEEYQRLARIFPHIESRNLSVAALARRIKTPYELNALRRDGATQSTLYHDIPGLYIEGMTELDLSLAVASQFRRAGHLGVVHGPGYRVEGRMDSVLAGDNGDVPSAYTFPLGGAGLHPAFPVGATTAQLQRGRTAMVNLCGNFSGYQPAMIRTFFLGPLPQKAQDLHEISLEVLHALADRAHAGVSCASLYEGAQDIVGRHRAEEYFMGHRRQSKSIGHGLGLECHERPLLAQGNRDELQEGMALVIQPVMMLPGVGPLGTGNSYIVHKNRLERLQDCDENLRPLGAAVE